MAYNYKHVQYYETFNVLDEIKYQLKCRKIKKKDIEFILWAPRGLLVKWNRFKKFYEENYIELPAIEFEGLSVIGLEGRWGLTFSDGRWSFAKSEVFYGTHDERWVPGGR